MENKTRQEFAKQLIKEKGGCSVVAKRFNTSIQQIFNWTKRGISYKYLAEYPNYFKLKKKN